MGEAWHSARLNDLVSILKSGRSVHYSHAKARGGVSSSRQRSKRSQSRIDQRAEARSLDDALLLALERAHLVSSDKFSDGSLRWLGSEGFDSFADAGAAEMAVAAVRSVEAAALAVRGLERRRSRISRKLMALAAIEQIEPALGGASVTATSSLGTASAVAAVQAPRTPPRPVPRSQMPAQSAAMEAAQALQALAATPSRVSCSPGSTRGHQRGVPSMTAWSQPQPGTDDAPAIRTTEAVRRTGQASDQLSAPPSPTDRQSESPKGRRSRGRSDSLAAIEAMEAMQEEASWAQVHLQAAMSGRVSEDLEGNASDSNSGGEEALLGRLHPASESGMSSGASVDWQTPGSPITGSQRGMVKPGRGAPSFNAMAGRNQSSGEGSGWESPMLTPQRTDMPPSAALVAATGFAGADDSGTTAELAADRTSRSQSGENRPPVVRLPAQVVLLPRSQPVVLQVGPPRADSSTQIPAGSSSSSSSSLRSGAPADGNPLSAPSPSAGFDCVSIAAAADPEQLQSAYSNVPPDAFTLRVLSHQQTAAALGVAWVDALGMMSPMDMQNLAACASSLPANSSTGVAALGDHLRGIARGACADGPEAISRLQLASKADATGDTADCGRVVLRRVLLDIMSSPQSRSVMLGDEVAEMREGARAAGRALVSQAPESELAPGGSVRTVVAGEASALESPGGNRKPKPGATTLHGALVEFATGLGVDGSVAQTTVTAILGAMRKQGQVHAAAAIGAMRDVAAKYGNNRPVGIASQRKLEDAVKRAVARAAGPKAQPGQSQAPSAQSSVVARSAKSTASSDARDAPVINGTEAASPEWSAQPPTLQRSTGRLQDLSSGSGPQTESPPTSEAQPLLGGTSSRLPAAGGAVESDQGGSKPSAPVPAPLASAGTSGGVASDGTSQNQPNEMDSRSDEVDPATGAMRLAEQTAVQAVRTAASVGMSLGEVLQHAEAEPDHVIASLEGGGAPLEAAAAARLSVAREAKELGLKLGRDMQVLLDRADDIPKEARGGLLQQHLTAVQVLCRAQVLASSNGAKA